MAFAFMRKYEKVILFVVVVIVLPSVGVTSAMFYVFGSKGGGPAAQFEVVPGERRVVSEEEYFTLKKNLSALNSMGGNRGTVSDEDTLDHLVRVEEAKAAGIVVSDEELANMLQGFLGGATAAQYRQFITTMGFTTAKDFEDRMRDGLLLQKLDELAGQSMRVTSEEIYDRFKEQRMRFSVEYIAFRAADRIQDLNPIDYKTPEVRKWYDEKNAASKNDPRARAMMDKYRIPDKLDLEVVYADFAGFDAATADEYLKDRKVEDSEMRAYYDAHLEWFTPEAPKTAPEKPDASDTEKKEPGKEPDSSAAGEEKPKAKPFDEVKDEIRRRILVTSLVQKALDAAKAEKNAKKGAVALEPIATKYHVKYRKLEGIDKTNLNDVELVGSDALASQVEALKPQDLPMTVATSRPDRAYFVRVLRQIPSRPKPFDEVEAQVRIDFMLDKLFGEMVSEADQLRTAIEERAKERVKDKKPEDLAAWEKEQEEKRKKKASGELTPEDEAKDLASLTRDADMNKKKKEFEKVWQAETGVVFDEIVKEKGLTTDKLEAYTVVARNDDSVKDEKDATRKYLRTNHMLDTLDAGMCSSSLLRDEENHTVYVAKLFKKEEPAWSELTKEEYDKIREEMLASRERSKTFLNRFQKDQRFQQTKLESRFKEKKPVVGPGPTPR